ncbi:MAG: TonB-dependent receptor [Bacteroidales bacterium]|nr:TonB-dependent receptor [Bacteroidales bacterium]
MRQPLLISFIVSCLCAWANNSPEPAGYTREQLDSIERVFNLNEIVITGTRTPKALKDVPVPTRLITEADLRQIDATNIQDLLQQEIPGVEFTYAMGQQINMNLSGFSGQGILILLDGERLAGETLENTDFSRLDLNGISRVEIIRGAASALYGSNATGGVINLISKEADKPLRLNVNARAADHHEWRGGAQLGIQYQKVNNMAEISHSRISTYTVCLDTKDQCDFRNVYGHRTWNVRDRLIYRPVDNVAITARAGYYFKERLFNVDTPDRYRDFSAGLRGEWTINPSNVVEASYAFDQYDKSDLIRESGLDVRDYSNVQNTVRAMYTHIFPGQNMLSVGADLTRDYLLTYQFVEGETHHQYTADAFVQYDHHIDSHWEAVGAVRWDYFSDGADNQLTAKLNLRYNTGLFTMRGGYSGGFRAPTLKEKYMMFNMADVFEVHGNPDLKAEKSHNFNLYGEYTVNSYYFAVGANYSSIHNRITTSGMRYGNGAEPYLDYLNVKRLKVVGVEATVRARWGCGLSASLSYNYTHEQCPDATANQYCPARPHALNFRGGWTWNWSKSYRTDLSVSGRYLSRVSYMSMYMYAPFEEKPVTNPAYTLWKVQLQQHIIDRFHVSVAVDNVFNYAPAVYSYNAPVTLGASLQLGLSIDIL